MLSLLVEETPLRSQVQTVETTSKEGSSTAQAKRCCLKMCGKDQVREYPDFKGFKENMWVELFGAFF